MGAAFTEAQARTKWCPFARVSGFGGSFNRLPSTPHASDCNGCIASDCMAWTWEVNGRLETEEESAQRRHCETGESIEDARRYVLMHYNYRVPAPPVVGFCGLSRRPRA